MSRPFAAKGSAYVARWITPFQGDRTFQVQFDFGTPNQVLMEPITGGKQDGTTYRFFKVYIGDGVSTADTVLSNGTTATQTIDVSTLDISQPWTVKISYPTVGELNAGTQDRNEVELVWDNPAGLFADGDKLEYDSTVENAGRLAVYAGGAKQTDGGTVNLGSFTASGTSEPFNVNIRAEGQGIVQVTSTTNSGDVLTFEDPGSNGYAYPGAVGFWLLGTVDSSGAAGSYSGTIGIVTAAGTYTLNIAYTLV